MSPPELFDEFSEEKIPGWEIRITRLHLFLSMAEA
jgi:hypothetical protein